MKNVRIVSIFIIILFSCFKIYFVGHAFNDVIVQNKIIDSINYVDSDYLGYIEIPRFGIRRLIKEGTSSMVLDDLYVGIFDLSGDITSDDLIILAGHNVSNVFSCLHNVLSGDYVYISYNGGFKKYFVYDKRIVDEYDFSYFNSRKNELLLITCDKKGYRLLVFLREDL